MPGYIQKIALVAAEGYANLEYMPSLTRPFDGLAAGIFTSMSGRRVAIKPDDLPEYLSNTKRALESTKDSKGNVVGCPIDTDAHNGAGGAGWITDVSLADGRDVLQYSPRWTDTGRDLIEGDIRRFFSSTIDVKNKVIVGGTLTNYPATRLESGEILLKPIELSMNLSNDDLINEEDSDNVTITVKNFATLQEMLSKFDIRKIIQDSLTKALHGKAEEERQLSLPPNNEKEAEMPQWLLDLLGITPTAGQKPEDVTVTPEQFNAALEAQIQERLSVQLASHQRMIDVDTLANLMIGGTPEAPVGLPIGKESFKSFMSSLNAEQFKLASELFTAIRNKSVIDFTEHGENGESAHLQELPAYIQTKLDSGELEVSDLSSPVLGLGDISKFNVAKYKKESA